MLLLPHLLMHQLAGFAFKGYLCPRAGRERYTQPSAASFRFSSWHVRIIVFSCLEITVSKHAKRKLSNFQLCFALQSTLSSVMPEEQSCKMEKAARRVSPAPYSGPEPEPNHPNVCVSAAVNARILAKTREKEEEV